MSAGVQSAYSTESFDYNHEMFLPKHKRKFDYSVLPLLGENLIGRIDPVMDRENEKLVINSVHIEPGAPTDKRVSSKIAEKITHLGKFLGVKEVQYTAQVPREWKNSFR